MNDSIRRACCCLALALSVSVGHSDEPATAPDRDQDQITQVSLINALMVGRYDGVMSIANLLRYGDFGVGTLDHLDGELIVLEGLAYQIRGDGEVVKVGPEWTTPFAVVAPFRPEVEFACPKVASLEELGRKVDEAVPQKNNFAAIRVDGRFDSITMRSVRRQEPPYKPLAEVARGQSVWTRQGVSGSLVGVRCPSWVGGLNVPGYHWHFLSDDRKVGGHVLDCQFDSARVRADVCRNWQIKLDGSSEANRADLGQNLSREIRRVESSTDKVGGPGR